MVIDASPWQSGAVQNAALTGPVAVVATLMLATGLGLWRRRRDGRLRREPAPIPGGGPGPDPADGNGRLVAAGLLAALGVQPGTPATLVLFSSAFCAPCRATRQVLTDVASTLVGVRQVEVDAASELPAVRALGIWRTPTVLVVDAAGRVVQRAAGVPARGQVIAAVAPLLTRAPS